jgi:hypothetical protein
MNVAALSEATLNSLIGDYLTLIALLVVVLLFGLYIWFIQAPLAEYFTGSPLLPPPTNGTSIRVARK